MTVNIQNDNNELNDNGAIKKLLENQNKKIDELEEKIDRINRYVTWQHVLGFLKVALFVVPIVLGIMYLPAILSDVVGQYKELLEFGAKTGTVPTSMVEVGNTSSELLNRILK